MGIYFLELIDELFSGTGFWEKPLRTFAHFYQNSSFLFPAKPPFAISGTKIYTTSMGTSLFIYTAPYPSALRVILPAGFICLC